jgi:RNA polymerase sigma-70 factor (ECF subfamily)
MSEPKTPERGLQSARQPSSATQAFAILAREHHRGLLVFARALARNDATAADLVQDAFVTAWRNLDNFDSARDFGAWLRGIVRNKWREHLRRHRREVDVDDATLEAWENRLALWDAGRQAGSPALFDALEDCLKRLPDTLGVAVSRYYYQDLPGDSIATALGIDTAALRKRLQRAREALRNCLDHKIIHPA